MADQNGRLVELVTEMLVKQERTNEILSDVVVHLQGLDSRVERLDSQQAKTNMLLQTHERDIIKLDDRLQKIDSTLTDIKEFLSQQVPHWGEQIVVETQTGPFSGWLRKAS